MRVGVSIPCKSCSPIALESVRDQRTGDVFLCGTLHAGCMALD
jgi:hypothetical protein